MHKPCGFSNGTVGFPWLSLRHDRLSFGQKTLLFLRKSGRPMSRCRRSRCPVILATFRTGLFKVQVTLTRQCVASRRPVDIYWTSSRGQPKMGGLQLGCLGYWASISLTWKMNNLENIIRNSELDRPITLQGYETWSGTYTEEHRLRVVSHAVLRRMFGAKSLEVTGKWRKPHNEKLNNLYVPTDVVRGMRWAGNVARVGRGEMYTELWWENCKKKTTWKTQK